MVIACSCEVIGTVLLQRPVETTTVKSENIKWQALLNDLLCAGKQLQDG
jgi:hypothetical protein